LLREGSLVVAGLDVLGAEAGGELGSD